MEYTKEEIQAWIKAQPDDRPVDMGNPVNDGIGNCHCLLGEFANDKGLDWANIGIRDGITLTNGDKIETSGLGDILKDVYGVNNFGEVKATLRE